MTKIIIEVKEGCLGQDEVLTGLRGVRLAYERIEALPLRKRRSLRVRKTLITLHAMEGLLKGLRK